MTFPRTRTLAFAATLCLSALPAVAQSQLDRMQVVSERANTLMNEAMASEIPSLAGKLLDPAWDDPMRTAYACILDGYVAASSTGAVDAMLDEMEALLEDATADSILNGEMAEVAMLPEGIETAQAQAILSGCGLMELMMTRMAESAAMGVMMQQSQ